MCLTITSMVVMTVRDTRETQRIWNDSRPVLVITRDVSPGDTIEADDVELRSLPEAVVPGDALTELPDNARTRVALHPRSVLTASLLTDSSSIVAVPDGWRVVALPASLPMPPVDIGDTVDVIGGSMVLVESALVASREPLTIAVPADLAPTVASAVRLGEISLVATG